MWTLALVVALSAGALGVTRDQFYPHGAGRDQRLPRGSEVPSPEHQLKVPILFYGETYDTIFVNNYGVLSFRADIPSFLNAEFPLPYPSIAAFYTNVDTTDSGAVYYRETNEPHVLVKAEESVQNNFALYYDFKPTSVFIATWLDVTYKERQDRKNSFQIAIISNGTESFVEMLYPEKEIQWFQREAQEASLPDAKAQAGFVAEDGRVFTLRGSGSHQIRNIVTWSNTHEPGKYVFRVGNIPLDGNVAVPDQYDQTEVEDEEESKTCAQSGPSVCHTQARCLDYQAGICCQCNEGFYGNGKSCIKDNVPLRVHGKLNGLINDVSLNDVDIQSYVVVADGRSYTALSQGPPALGSSLQLLSVLGGVIGWLFAKPSATAKNGYQLTGSLFNHTADIFFPSTGDRVTINQEFLGHDVFDQITVETDIRGSIPVIIMGTKLEISEYEEQYTQVNPGLIRSESIRTFTNKVTGEKYEQRVSQSVTYFPCRFAPPSEEDAVPSTLKVGKNYLGYETKDNIVRYGMSNKIVPLGQEDPCINGRSTCGPHSTCVVQGDSFSCVCQSGFTNIYLDDSAACIDVDECAAGTHNCDTNADCYNHEGGFQCRCRAEFEGNGVSCKRLLKCREKCGANAQCVDNGNEPAACVCNSGYTGNGETCHPEAYYACENCSPNARCAFEQEQNYYRCVCNDGFTGDGIYCAESGNDRSNDQQPSQEPRDNRGDGENAAPPHQPSYYPTPYYPTPYTSPSPSTTNEDYGNRNQYPQYPPNAPPTYYDGDRQQSHSYPPSPSPPARHDDNDEYLAQHPEYPPNAPPSRNDYDADRQQYHSYPPSPSPPAVRDDDEYRPQYPNYSPVQSQHENRDDEEYSRRYPQYPSSTTPSPPETHEADYNETVVLPNCDVTRTCTCPPGYTSFKDERNNGLCRNDNYRPPNPLTEYKDTSMQCDSDSDCPPNAMCSFSPTDPFGTGHCVCPEGYEGDGYECIERTGPSCSCGVSAHCIDTAAGELLCVCDVGYHGDGYNCRPNFSCANNTDCDRNAECRPDTASHEYVCQCIEGYVKNENEACIADKQLCNGAICADHAYCLYDATIGVNYCHCEAGYEGEGISLCVPQGTTCDVANDCHSDAVCAPADTAYQCVCNEGFTGDGYSCTPEPTCRSDPYMCDTHASCLKRGGGFVCECNAGYTGNGSSCDLNPRQSGNFIVASDGASVYKIPFRVSPRDFATPIISAVYQIAVGVDVDCHAGRIYWGDVVGNTIRRAAYDGSDLEAFLLNDVKSPEGLAVDWSARNIFWTDSKKLTIEVANMDTRLRKVLFANDGISNPRGIAVHPQRGKVFWSDWNRNAPKIEWANMDGSQRGVFLDQPDVKLPNSLAIDWARDRLCYADAGLRSIKCVSLDTLEKETITTNCSHPFGLAISGDRFYWSDWKTLKIEYIDTVSQLKGQVPTSAASKRLFGITVAPEQCPASGNVCQYRNGNCRPDELCLPDGRGSRSCVAEDNNSLRSRRDIR